MIDTEVIRLRQLRTVALRTRALALAFDSRQPRGTSVFSRSALACWRIARAVTGQLRAHPYLSYQRGPSMLRSLADGTYASLMAAAAMRRGRSLTTYAHELQRVAQELDDVRALTWSAELSDTLGRFQSELRILSRAVGAGARIESGSRIEAAAPLRAPDGNHRDAVNAASTWPYLAL